MVVNFPVRKFLKAMFTQRSAIILKRAVFWILLFLGSNFQARALIINPEYDTTVTTATNAAQIETAFGVAAQTIESLYTNPITINIMVYWGTNGPSNPFSGGIGLGASSTEATFETGFGYVQLTNALWAVRKTVAQISADASFPATDPLPNGSTNVVPTAEAKALNILGETPNNPSLDGDVGFSTDPGIVFAFSPTNRAVAGEYDFIGVAEHEITEVMGRTTFDLNTYYVPFDFFRFTGTGVRNLSPSTFDVYFSINNGTNVLKYYNDPGNGGDLQDWASPSTPPDSYDAFSYSNSKNTISYEDLIALNILGYDLNYTPPKQTITEQSPNVVQLTFTNISGLAYGVIATTNLNPGSANWNAVGTPTENPAGQYEYTITQVTNSATFYSIVLH